MGFMEDNMKKFGTNIEQIVSANLGETWKNELDGLLVSLDALVQGNFINFVNAPGDLILEESSLLNQVWIINFIGLPEDLNPYESYHGYILRYNGLGEFSYIQPKNGWKMYNSTTNREYIYTMHGSGLGIGPEWIDSFDYYSRYVNLLTPISNTAFDNNSKITLTGALTTESATLTELLAFFDTNSSYDNDAFLALQKQVDDLVTGFVGVRDITPIGVENVNNKSTDSDGLILTSCSVSSLTFDVHVLAITGIQKLKPVVKIKYDDSGDPLGIPITLTAHTTENLWIGTIRITIPTAGNIEVVHEGGYKQTCVVNYVAKPVITNIQFTNSSYPLVNQTAYPAGRTVNVTVTSDISIDYVDVISDGTTASIASTSSVTLGTTATFDITTTNHETGNNYPVKIRVRTPNVGLSPGTFSNIYSSGSFDGGGDHVRTIKINNTLPTVAFGTITYSSGFRALKGFEGATVVMTTTNITLPLDTVTVTSNNSELTVTDGTVLGNKAVTRAGGGYNITTPNLNATVYKTSNDTTASTSTVVFIAHTPQVITVYIPKSGGGNYTRLRSGGSYGSAIPSYPVTIESNQKLLNEVISDIPYKPTIDASVGVFSLTPFVSDGTINKVWTRQLSIRDFDTKGIASFSNLSTFNLAGIEVTTVASLPTLNYTVGGFVERVITFSKYEKPTFNREADIGTQVITTSKLKATNKSMSPSHSYDVTYNQLVVDDPEAGPFTYSITNNDGISDIPGTYVYNNNSHNATGNNAVDSDNWVRFEIEETE